MAENISEILGATVSGIILMVLTFHMGNKQVHSQPGSKLILAGFSLFFFGMLIDLTDSFSFLNNLVAIGNTQVESLIAKLTGTLIGLLLLSIGFYRWFPSITELNDTKLKLETLSSELNERNEIHSIELKISTNYLKEELEIRKKIEKKLRQQALLDKLTNLPNRALSLDRLNQHLKEASRINGKVAVLFLDLDDFKKVNETLGHEVGDQFLIQAAERLTNEVRVGDTVGRLGGDEFIILLRGISNVSNTAHIAENILNQFRTPFSIDDRQLILTASIGISIFPDDTNDASFLLRHTDSAMYHSKEKGGNNYSFFTPEMNENVSRRLLLEEQMHNALEQGEFKVLYQPKIDIKRNRIVGAEALLRWNNPKLGDVSPGEFIPLAENTGMIIPLSEFVQDEALKATGKWMEKIPGFKISVNLSPCQFRDPDFIPKIKNKIFANCISGDCLELEITEGVLMTGHGYIDDAISKLNNLGVSIAMDDFGTGYSSLSYLRRYPFDVLKIDRSFVNDITTDPSDRELINATIAMAHGLNLKVVAEGVETEEQLKYLKGLGCDYAQGYLFSKAVPESEMSAIIKKEIQE